MENKKKMENKKILGKHKRDDDDDEIFPELKKRKLQLENQEDRDLFDGEKLINRSEDAYKKMCDDFLIKIIDRFPHAAKEAIKKGETRVMMGIVAKEGKYGIICKSKRSRFTIIDRLLRSGVLKNYDLQWDKMPVPGIKDEPEWCLYAKATK